MFVARNNDGHEQPLAGHLTAAAGRAATYAEPWGKDFAYVCALVHDIGKYSLAFQDRVRGCKKRVDHATAGAQLPKIGTIPLS